MVGSICIVTVKTIRSMTAIHLAKAPIVGVAPFAGGPCLHACTGPLPRQRAISFTAGALEVATTFTRHLRPRQAQTSAIEEAAW
jgi:hypothetical protein